MIRTTWRLALALIPLMFATAGHAQDKLSFSTDWLAEAEHGGFYQALAEGIYKKHGLDVELKSGGPQVNGLQLLAAGQLDIVMADALQVMAAVEQQVPVTAIAATVQKNPAVIIAHPGVTNLGDLMTNPVQSRQLQQRKLDNALARKPDLIVTANPGCLLQLKSGLAERGARVEVKHLAEVLDEASAP